MTVWAEVTAATDAYVIDEYVLGQYVAFDWEAVATGSTTWT